MSRIGKLPVPIPEKTEVTLSGSTVKVKGPKGALEYTATSHVVLSKDDKGITVKPANNSKTARSLWGTTRTRIQNLMIGVTEGYSKKMEINGVGYRAAMKGKDIELQLGFSNPVVYAVPEDITVKCAKPTEIEVTGIDKQKVGQVAAEIRRFRPPEPYKGKGVKYVDEYIFRKEGKKK